MIDLLRKISVEALFPASCLGCRAWGSFLCKRCAEQLRPIERQECPSCRVETVGGGFCSETCASSAYFDCLIVAMRYDDNPLLRKLIRAFKYRFYKDIADRLADIMKKYLIGADLVVPVPIHPKRLKFRGFNQAEELAARLPLPMENLLVRNTYRASQAHLDKNARWRNLSNAIELSGQCSEQRILLVDDVATTGSTLNACAKALKAGGAREVSCLVLARSNTLF